MALTDVHWNKAIEALSFKAIESNRDISKMDDLALLLQENWELLSVEKDLDVYIKAQKLPDLKSKRDAHQIAVDDLNIEIAAIERR